MITTKKELKFYIKADSIANFGIEGNVILALKRWCGLGNIDRYLRILRHYEYYQNAPKSRLNQILLMMYKYKWHKIGQKLGLTIYPNTCEYGLRIPHWGTIVIGPNNKIGAHALLHTSICIPTGNRIIGNFIKMSSGSKITGNNLILGNGITIAANSVVTKSFNENVLLAGMPAVIKKESRSWIISDGPEPLERFYKIEKLKETMGIGQPLELQ